MSTGKRAASVHADQPNACKTRRLRRERDAPVNSGTVRFRDPTFLHKAALTHPPMTAKTTCSSLRNTRRTACSHFGCARDRARTEGGASFRRDSDICAVTGARHHARPSHGRAKLGGLSRHAVAGDASTDAAVRQPTRQPRLLPTQLWRGGGGCGRGIRRGRGGERAGRGGQPGQTDRVGVGALGAAAERRLCAQPRGALHAASREAKKVSGPRRHSRCAPNAHPPVSTHDQPTPCILAHMHTRTPAAQPPRPFLPLRLQSKGHRAYRSQSGCSEHYPQ